MFRLLFLLAALPLAACTASTEIRDGEGRVAHLIECYGNPLSYCFERAAKTCPAGYETVGMSQGGSLVTATQYGLVGSSGTNKQLVVRCQ
jgi:hypothetical protein